MEHLIERIKEFQEDVVLFLAEFAHRILPYLPVN